MQKNISCVIDNLVIYTEEVTMTAFHLLREKLSDAEMKGEIPPVRFSIGTGASDYHYRLNIGQGGGAIAIGFKHNTSRSEDFYRMRLEFNPQKNKKLYEGFWRVYNALFFKHARKVKQFDLAFDVPIELRRISCVSLSGRQKGYFKSTQYYGSPGNHGRLKIYDKKTELEESQGIAIVHEHMSRIEYTVRIDEPMTVQWISKVSGFCINEQYKIVCLNEEKLSGELKACILALQNDLVLYKEFTRTTKKKIKEAFDSMEELDLDQAYLNAHKENMKLITSYLSI